MSCNSWKSCTPLLRNIIGVFSRRVSQNSLITALNSCKSRVSRYDGKALRTPDARQEFHKSDWQLNYFGADCSLFFTSDRLCGKPGGSSCCHGVSGNAMWSHGAESDFHATARDVDSSDISEQLLLHPIIIFRPTAGLFGELEQTSGKTSNGRRCEVSASRLSVN